MDGTKIAISLCTKIKLIRSTSDSKNDINGIHDDFLFPLRCYSPGFTNIMFLHPEKFHK